MKLPGERSGKVIEYNSLNLCSRCYVVCMAYPGNASGGRSSYLDLYDDPELRIYLDDATQTVHIAFSYATDMLCGKHREDVTYIGMADKGKCDRCNGNALTMVVDADIHKAWSMTHGATTVADQGGYIAVIEVEFLCPCCGHYLSKRCIRLSSTPVTLLYNII